MINQILKTTIVIISISFVHPIYSQKVGINVPNPTSTLDVDGNFRLTDGTQGNGKVLTSDAAGFATWQVPAASSSNPTAGYGSWNPCESPNLCEYQPSLIGSGVGDDADGNYMGRDVAIYGDYAVVGAPDADLASINNVGFAYVYHFNGSQWIMEQTLYDPNGEAGDRFGRVVEITENFIFAASKTDDIGSNIDQGSVCIFQRSGSTWNYLQKIQTTDPQSYDFFGSSIAIDGNTAVVGCTDDSPVGSADFVGSVTFYNYNGTTGFWMIGPKIFHPTLQAGSAFGSSVGLHNEKLIVGSPFAYNQIGTAHVYHKVGSTWTYIQELALTNSFDFEAFGYDVDIYGDDIAVSAPFRMNNDSIDAGIVALYNFNGSSWQKNGQKDLDPNESTQYFGKSIDISDGYMIIGSSQSKNPDFRTGTDEGKSVIYQKVNSGWIKLEIIIDPASEKFDYAQNVAINGTTKRFLIGAPGALNSGGKVIFGKFKN
jgi:hypothetical protein